MTLPWYRPTRVMLLTPGSDAGWVGDAWKDPDHRVTMPKVLANLGRGSPTGVVVYRHRAFPPKYDGAILALDWTFGRILAVYPEQYSPKADESEQREWRLGAETFLQAQGSAGFAPTDICVEPDGSLLVCVGGRGTRGAVYRIKYVGQDAMPSPQLFAAEQSSATPSQEASPAPTPLSKEYVEALTQIVYAPCPLESWSTVQWRRQLKVLGPGTLASVAIDGLSSPDGQHRLESTARVGAIQRLVQENVSLSHHEYRATPSMYHSRSTSRVVASDRVWASRRKTAGPSAMEVTLLYRSSNVRCFGRSMEYLAQRCCRSFSNGMCRYVAMARPQFAASRQFGDISLQFASTTSLMGILARYEC
ncbi:MAG: hypothetical protein U0905_03015 [Pirellulales bacterium]